MIGSIVLIYTGKKKPFEILVIFAIATKGRTISLVKGSKTTCDFLCRDQSRVISFQVVLKLLVIVSLATKGVVQ
jgi:hypothetical protein